MSLLSTSEPARPAHAARVPAARPQRGYALVMVMCFVAIVAASALAAAPSVLTEGRRQQEEEMEWRGNQYVRGIKMYYRKLGKYPTTIDDLTKPKLGTVRFMRAEYKDPMNQTDGTWRLIYVGPAGQLIGSLLPQSNPQTGAPGLGTSASAVASSSSGSAFGASNGLGSGGSGPSATTTFGSSSSAFGSSSSFSSSSSPNSSSGFGTPVSSFSNSGNSGSSATGDSGQPYDPATDPMLNPPAGLLDSVPTIIGGNITGVGSKVNRHSIKVLNKAKNYLLFEFVWNPAKDNAAALQQLAPNRAAGIGTSSDGTPQNPNGLTPPATTPGTGTPPAQNPQSTPPQQ